MTPEINKKSYYQDIKVAKSYDSIRFSMGGGQLTHLTEVSFLKNIFQKNEKLLEIACGTGRILKEMNRDGWNVYGLEQSEAMLKAGALINSDKIIKGDAFLVPISDESFDGIYSFRFTNHYSDLKPLFSEIHRLLKPGGHAVFDVMQWSPLFFPTKLFGGNNFCQSARQISLWLAESKLSVQEVSPLFPIGPYILGRLPRLASQTILQLGKVLPTSVQSISAWHVRKFI